MLENLYSFYSLLHRRPQTRTLHLHQHQHQQQQILPVHHKVDNIVLY